MTAIYAKDLSSLLMVTNVCN